MTVATTLKLSEQLKRRVVPLARSAGKTPHAWMIEAIAAQAGLAERHAEFVRDALVAERETSRTGKVYRAEDVHRYLRARAAGRKAKRPAPSAW